MKNSSPSSHPSTYSFTPRANDGDFNRGLIHGLLVIGQHNLHHAPNLRLGVLSRATLIHLEPDLQLT